MRNEELPLEETKGRVTLNKAAGGHANFFSIPPVGLFRTQPNKCQSPFARLKDDWLFFLALPLSGFALVQADISLSS